LDTTSLITQNNLTENDTYQSGTFGHTYLISPTVVNSFHADYNHAYNLKGDINMPSPCQLGIQNFTCTPGLNFTGIGIGTDVNFSTNLIPVYFNPTDYQVSDDVSISHGSHQFTVGADWVHFAYNQIGNILNNGAFTFTANNTGLLMYDYLVGDVSTFQQASVFANHPRKKYVGLYAQDSWQFNRKLTINYGLRWEPFIAPNNGNGEAYHFNIANYIAGIHSKVYPTAPAGLIYPSVGTGPGDYQGYGNNYLSTWSHFEPRIGFSYDPRGKGREVIRASYGTFYDYEYGQGTLTEIESPPWGDEVVITNAKLDNPYGSAANNPYPITGIAFPAPGQYQTWQTLKTAAPMLQQWNASIQKQFGASWSITVSYVGNHGTHSIINTDGNPAEYVPGTCTAGGFFPATTFASPVGNISIPANTYPDGLTTNGACSTSGNAQNRRDKLR